MLRLTDVKESAFQQQLAGACEFVAEPNFVIQEMRIIRNQLKPH